MTDAVVTEVMQPADTSRRKFLVGATTALGTVGAVGIATPFVSSWNPSAKAKAAGAPVKVDISKILPGEQALLISAMIGWEDISVRVTGHHSI
jgi:ubiquinol-cytochrome c reductase iron-sulfur subunit